MADMHVELLCGGTPSFLVARALKNRLKSYDASVSLIRVDREEELVGEADDEHFFSFVWTEVLKRRLRERVAQGPDAFPLLQRVRKEQIETVLNEFGETNPPFNNVVGVQLAFELTWHSVSQQLEKDLDNASQKSQVWVCPCVVFEGPTGTGVGWGLMDRLELWIDAYRKDHYTNRRLLQRRNFRKAMLEFIPELPGVGGDEQNILQGAVSRARAHARHSSWGGLWMRFDGGKVKTGSNAMADALGAAAMALLLTAEVPPVVHGLTVT